MDYYKYQISKVDYKLYKILDKIMTYITEKNLFSKCYQKQIYLAIDNIIKTKNDDTIMICKLCLLLKVLSSKIQQDTLINREEYEYFTYIYKYINFYDEQHYKKLINSMYIITYMTKFISYFCQKYINFNKHIQSQTLNIEILELVLAFIEFDKYNYSTDIKLKNTNIIYNRNILNYVTYKMQGKDNLINSVNKLTDIKTNRIELPSAFIKIVETSSFIYNFYKMRDTVFNNKINKLYYNIDNGIYEDTDSEYDNLSENSNYDNNEEDEENEPNEEDTTFIEAEQSSNINNYYYDSDNSEL